MIVYNKKTNKLEASGPNGYNDLPFDNGCRGIIISAIIIIMIFVALKIFV